jgi:hypothetical protein
MFAPGERRESPGIAGWSAIVRLFYFRYLDECMQSDINGTEFADEALQSFECGAVLNANRTGRRLSIHPA